MNIVRHKVAWENGSFINSIRIAIANMRVDEENALNSLRNSPNRSRDRLEKLNVLLNGICSERCHLAVLPEISVPHAWLRWLSWVAAQRELGIVVGLEHNVKDGVALNHIATLLPFRHRGRYKTCYVSIRLKRHYAPAELSEIEGCCLLAPSPPQQPLQPYDLFMWRGCSFTVFNC